MSLPTTKQAQQPSIRSFFTAKQPKYAPPPSSTASSANGALPVTTAAPPPPPPPPPPTAEQSPQPSSTAPYPPPPPSLPQDASIRPITSDDIAPLRRINTLLLPVPYPPDFYNRATDPSSTSGRYSRVITYTHDSSSTSPGIVGGIVSRLVDDPASAGSSHLYISSLCVLAPYRGLGLVSAALDHIVNTAVLDKGCDVTAVTAHVWTGHEESLGWYERRGFVKQEPVVEGYYLKLRPSSAWIVKKEITNRVLSALPSQATAPPPTTSTNGAVKPSTTAAIVNLASPTNGKPPSNGSFQNQRPETEWNDLPADMAPGLLAPPKNGNGTQTPGSAASSRSSSTVRKKRDRSYPAAAFGAN